MSERLNDSLRQLSRAYEDFGHGGKLSLTIGQSDEDRLRRWLLARAGGTQ